MFSSILWSNSWTQLFQTQSVHKHITMQGHDSDEEKIEERNEKKPKTIIVFKVEKQKVYFHVKGHNGSNK